MPGFIVKVYNWKSYMAIFMCLMHPRSCVVSWIYYIYMCSYIIFVCVVAWRQQYVSRIWLYLLSDHAVESDLQCYSVLQWEYSMSYQQGRYEWCGFLNIQHVMFQFIFSTGLQNRYQWSSFHVCASILYSDIANIMYFYNMLIKQTYFQGFKFH